jgi:Domain of Unknown Function with PDB structure (DUF3857)/Transglutaminase-like superfamily
MSEALKMARELIRIGPTPEWVVSRSFELGFAGRPGVPLTHLLLERQIHAERNQICQRTVTRLETMEAVQHESQWRLQFDGRCQRVTLHWVKLHRGNQQFDHAHLDKIRLLQREEGLERFVVDGWHTMLLLLEDVRPGDVLESCYTLESQPKLMPEHCASFFRLPQGIPVGKFGFSARFNQARAMNWKSSSPDLKPMEQRENEEVLWTWTGEKHFTPELEVNAPEWHMAFPWVQVSDCPTWGAVAAGIAAAWNEEPEDNAVGVVAKEIMESHGDELSRAEGVLRLVQDEHRYLSVDLDVGGHVPTPPATVLRRRFGDCKDLSFLLVHLLRRLGIEARPVLVNSVLGRSIPGLLPTPNLFNHAVVEFTVQGQVRWVDATLRGQGGGPLNRLIPNFGTGLPVDSAATDLVQPPAVPDQKNTYELTESLLLDTTGAPSILGIVLRTTGGHAEALRQKFETLGPDKIAQERLQIWTQRFVKAQRAGLLQHRDNRAANEFVLTEVFEVSGFLSDHPEPGMCTFRLPGNLVVDVLRLPEKGTRRTPFALPFPCEIIHTVEVESAALQPMAAPRCSLSSPYVQFSRRQKSLYKYWSMTLNLTTLADAVPASEFDEHEKLVEQIWKESNWGLFMPMGVSHPRRRQDFGELPRAAADQASSTTRFVRPESENERSSSIGAQRAAPREDAHGKTASERKERTLAVGARPNLNQPRASSRPRERRRLPRARLPKTVFWTVMITLILLATLLIVAVALHPLSPLRK